MIELDFSGLRCPEPYIKLVEKINECSGNFVITFDDVASFVDIKRLLNRKQIDIIKIESIDKKTMLYCKKNGD